MPRVLLVALALVASAVRAQTVSIFDLKGRAEGLVVAADGNLWFPYFSGIGRMMPRGEMATIPMPVSLQGTITRGPDDKVWYTRFEGIASLDVRSGAQASYDVPELGLNALTVAADGNVWFPVRFGIGRVTPRGENDSFILGYVNVVGIAADAHRNIWFTGAGIDGVGRMTPEGAVTVFPAAGYATLVVPGTDGTIWTTTAIHGAKIVRLSADGNILTQVPVREYPRAMAVGPDNRLWISRSRGFVIISPDGTVGSFDVPEAVDGFIAIAVTPDGNVWGAIDLPIECLSSCEGYDPPVGPSIVRVNLVNPAPAITAVTHAADGLIVRGVGFVPDTVIRVNGIDRTTTYRTPFEVRLDAALDAGTIVAVNKAPGGGASAPFEIGAETPRRRRAAH